MSTHYYAFFSLLFQDQRESLSAEKRETLKQHKKKDKLFEYARIKLTNTEELQMTIYNKS